MEWMHHDSKANTSMWLGSISVASFGLPINHFVVVVVFFGGG